MISDDPSEAGPSPPPPIAPPDPTTAIGARLHQIFDEAAAEPLPEAFAELLRKLD